MTSERETRLPETHSEFKVLDMQNRAPSHPIIGFLGGLPVQTNFETLERYVKNFGPISNLSFPVNSITGKHKGFAKVIYKHQESLDKAISQPSHRLHGVEFGFSVWVSKKSFTPKKGLPSRKKLFIKMESYVS